MHRQLLIKLLAEYQPTEAADTRARNDIEAFVRAYPDCFSRSLQIGHVTGSAWLVDAENERVLLTHHRKLGKWLQLGGHADGDPELLHVALREAREESGIDDIVSMSPAIFDLDVHEIPVHACEPAHLHYDVRFLLRAAAGAQARLSPESKALAWIDKGQLPNLLVDESVLRMHRKWLVWPNAF